MSVSNQYNQLFTEVLAMDSYDRGYGASIYAASFPQLSDSNGQLLGYAKIESTDGGPNAKAIGFYAITYSWNGQTVISFRGTDNYNPLDNSNDIINGWLGGAGLPTTQSSEAMSYYNIIVSVFGGPVLLTGHSLGGGLAGYISALTGTKADVFDTMPYAAAAVTEAIQTAGDDLYNLLTGDGDTTDLALPDASNITSEYTLGEALQYIRAVAPVVTYYAMGPVLGLLEAEAAVALPLEANNLAPLDPYAGAFASPINLHSIALLILLQYAKDNKDTAWQSFGPSLYSAYFNGSVPAALGLVQGATTVSGATGSGSPSAQMLSMIAYSVIDAGTMPFGDAAVQALFHDGDEIGSLYSSAGVPSILTASNVEADFADIVVEYAGFLAINADTSITHTKGVISYDTVNAFIKVDLSTATWTSSGGHQPTSIVGESNLILSAFGNVSAIADYIVFATNSEIAHTIDLSSDTGIDLVRADDGTDTFLLGSGQADLVAGSGTDIVEVNVVGAGLTYIGSTGTGTIDASALTSSELIDIEGGGWFHRRCDGNRSDAETR